MATARAVPTTALKMPGSLVVLSALVLGLHLLTESALAAPVLLTSKAYDSDSEDVERFCRVIPLLAPKDSNETKTENCCLPAPKKVVNFTFPEVTIVRERKPVHVVAKDPVYVEKYNRAYDLMKALPSTDPRSFDTQWKTHCAFCSGGYPQRRLDGSEPLNATGHNLIGNVHGSWMFLPWHRMQLYFHEKILASLINDPTFALPFWNWDNVLTDEAEIISPMYLPGFKLNNSAIIDENRSPVHEDRRLHLAWTPNPKDGTNWTLYDMRNNTLASLKQAVVSSVSTLTFFGAQYPADENPRGKGQIESLHNNVHKWVGTSRADPKHPNGDDMGTLTYAARDPIFYTHHANIDRMWRVWEDIPDKVSKGAHRSRHASIAPDFHDSEFTFFDENGDMVLVKADQALDISKLGYKYSDMGKSDMQWRNFTPIVTPKPTKPLNTSAYPLAMEAPGIRHIIDGNLSSTFRVVRQPPTLEDLDRAIEVEGLRDLEEVILIKHINIPIDKFVRFDVFINYPEADIHTPMFYSAYVGAYVQLADGVVDILSAVDGSRLGAGTNAPPQDIRLPIGNTLKYLNITDDKQDIVVTVVPKDGSKGGFSFESLRQRWD